MTIVTDIARLRRMVDEPDSTTYTVADLVCYLMRHAKKDIHGEMPMQAASAGGVELNDDWVTSFDLNAAAGDIWEEKAAVEAAGTDFVSGRSRHMLSQKHKNMMARARRFWSLRTARSFAVVGAQLDGDITSLISGVVELVIQPNEIDGIDCYVSSDEPEINFGTALTLLVGGDSDNYLSFYVEFPLTDIPDDVIILEAEFSCYVDQVSDAGAQYIIERAAAAWVESTLTYNNKPGGTESEIASGTMGTVGWVDTDVLTELNAWLDETYDNDGLVVYQDEAIEGDYSTLTSSGARGTEAGQAPKLTVLYLEWV